MEGVVSVSRIVKLIIRGASGYGPVDEAYNDKLAIDAGAISYELKPVVETDTFPARKWSYRTNSLLYLERFRQLCTCLPMVIAKIPEEAFCTDIGGIDFTITYEDGTKEKKSFWLPGSYFKDAFDIIKTMIPPCEETPAVLE
jgi:hypothetical protein